MSEQPATSAGTTRPAGEGVDDQEMTSEVGDQTSSDLKTEQVFENEQDGTYTETEAAKAEADEMGG